MLLPYCYHPMRNVSCVVCASLGRRLESSERVSCSTVFTITIYYMSPVIINQCRQSIGPCPAAGGRRVRTSHPAGTCARGGGCRSCVGCSLELDIAHAATRRLWFHGLLAQRNSNSSCRPEPCMRHARDCERGGTNVSSSQKVKTMFRHH